MLIRKRVRCHEQSAKVAQIVCFTFVNVRTKCAHIPPESDAPAPRNRVSPAMTFPKLWERGREAPVTRWMARSARHASQTRGAPENLRVARARGTGRRPAFPPPKAPNILFDKQLHQSACHPADGADRVFAALTRDDCVCMVQPCPLLPSSKTARSRCRRAWMCQMAQLWRSLCLGNPPILRRGHRRQRRSLPHSPGCSAMQAP